MNDHGFSLMEMLIATALLTLLIASTFDLVNPTQGSFQAHPETADLQQRLRVAADVVGATIRGAGAGTLVGGSRGPLIHSLPGVVGPVSFVVRDMLGRELRRWDRAATPTSTLDLSDLPNGAYHLEARIGDSRAGRVLTIAR